MRWWPKKWEWTADEVPIAVLLPEPLATEARALLAAGDRIGAVRRVRQRTHLTLLPAVLAVDALRGDGGQGAS
jgi:hypothetical protein